MKLAKFCWIWMVIPSLVQEIFLSPLYQLLSYYYAFQGGIPLFSIITALDTLIRLIACGVFFAAAAGLIACSYNCRRKMVLPMAFYIALHAVNKLFAFLTVYLLTLFGLSDFTMSMLGAAMPTLFTYAAWDLAAGALMLLLTVGVVLIAAGRPPKTKGLLVVFTYGVLQLGAALYQLVSNIAYAGAPGSFFDVAVLAGPFVRAILFAAFGCGLLRYFTGRLLTNASA